MQGNTSFAHWTLRRQIVQTPINVSSSKQRSGFFNDSSCQGSFYVWNCINERYLNDEVVILLTLWSKVSNNIKPLNHRAVSVPETCAGKRCLFLSWNTRSQSFLLRSSCLCQQRLAVELGSPANPCHCSCSVPASGKGDYPGYGAALTARAQFIWGTRSCILGPSLAGCLPQTTNNISRIVRRTFTTQPQRFYGKLKLEVSKHY